MIKFLLTGILLYFAYKLMFQPSLKAGASQQKNIYKEKIEPKPSNGTRKVAKEDYIDYEEVE